MTLFSPKLAVYERLIITQRGEIRVKRIKGVLGGISQGLFTTSYILLIFSKVG
jgi:hypothetical protein